MTTARPAVLKIGWPAFTLRASRPADVLTDVIILLIKSEDESIRLWSDACAWISLVTLRSSEILLDSSFKRASFCLQVLAYFMLR